ncbi:MAG TPA: hypothetical protein VJB57_04285 [Dehalococcoidia bacterium]|nr:hypothetical protein [Dehalococcoidia bacterium]
MTKTPKCAEEIEVGIAGRDLWITRLALQDLMAIETREEHVYHDIRAALAKLPEGHELESSECDCELERTNV